MPRLNGIPVSPRARRLISKHGLAAVGYPGTGPNGRIVEVDVLAAGLPKATAKEGRKQLSQMRRAIALRTTESFSIPHFYLRAEVDATEMLAFRERRLKQIESCAGIRVTATDILLKAMGTALTNVPEANCVWRDDSIEILTEANIGLVVVAVPGGLLIPVVRAVDSLSLEQLVQQRQSLVEAARSGGLADENTAIASSTLSNLGKSRVDEFSAILAPGQTTILAVGRIASRPFVIEAEGGALLAIRPTVRLSLSVDHRVLDGDGAAKYLGSIIEGLENPENLFNYCRERR